MMSREGTSALGGDESDDDQEMKKAFFQELEARHGRQLTYEDLQEWETKLDEGSSHSEDEVEGEEDDVILGSHAHPSMPRSKPLPAGGWLTPSSPMQLGLSKAATADATGTRNGSSSIAVIESRQSQDTMPTWCDEELDCVVTESLVNRSYSWRSTRCAAESAPGTEESLDNPPVQRFLDYGASTLSRAALDDGRLPFWHIATPENAAASADTSTSSSYASGSSMSGNDLDSSMPWRRSAEGVDVPVAHAAEPWSPPAGAIQLTAPQDAVSPEGFVTAPTSTLMLPPALVTVHPGSLSAEPAVATTSSSAADVAPGVASLSTGAAAIAPPSPPTPSPSHPAPARFAPPLPPPPVPPATTLFSAHPPLPASLLAPPAPTARHATAVATAAAATAAAATAASKALREANEPDAAPDARARTAAKGCDSKLLVQRAATAEVGVLKGQLSALREQYEHERAEWHKREEQLQRELSEASRLSRYRQHLAKGGALTECAMPAAELARIEADIAQQETLIAGYQKENERLTEALKAAREAQRTDAAKGEEEARRLALRLSEMERTAAERAPDGLRNQLESAHVRLAEEREAAAERESEMRFEMDRLRAAKRELEGKLAGVDLGQLHSDHQAVREAEAKVREIEEARKKEVAALQAKLTWYTENQQLIDELEQQRLSALARVAELTSALDGQVGGGAASAGGAFGPPVLSVSSASAGGGGDGTSGRRMSDAERVAVLEKQVSGLQQLLERRTAVAKGMAGGGARGRGGERGGRGRSDSMPSVAELIAAAGPTPQEVQRTAFLETRVSQLEETVCELEATHAKRLRALRQQSERVAAGYEAKVALLTDKLQKAEALLEGKGAGAATRSKVKELERQIEEIRATHTKRVKELEAKAVEAERAAAREASRRAAAAARERDMKTRGPQPDSARRGGNAVKGGMEPIIKGGMEPIIYTGDSADAADDGEAEGGGTIHDAQPALDLVAELASSLALALARLEGGLGVLDCAMGLPAALAGTAAGMSLAGVGAGGSGEASQDNDMFRMQTQLRMLERRQIAREAEAAELLETTRHLALVEAERAKREMSAVLESKNAEVEAYRIELDAIVLDMKLLHAKQAEAMALETARFRRR